MKSSRKWLDVLMNSLPHVQFLLLSNSKAVALKFFCQKIFEMYLLVYFLNKFSFIDMIYTEMSKH